MSPVPTLLSFVARAGNELLPRKSKDSSKTKTKSVKKGISGGIIAAIIIVVIIIIIIAAVAFFFYKKKQKKGKKSKKTGGALTQPLAPGPLDDGHPYKESYSGEPTSALAFNTQYGQAPQSYAPQQYGYTEPEKPPASQTAYYPSSTAYVPPSFPPQGQPGQFGGYGGGPGYDPKPVY
ncbi:hypothetical protein DL96DRAFT_1596335 [Flagelloscypha sp. PMI_526]|nr:hypothetical protein DL96DRAFT_1596335 [Flagelloscypha sp. PMI_526]